MGRDGSMHRHQLARFPPGRSDRGSGPVQRFGDEILTEADIPRRRRPRARQAVLRELLVTARVGGCWLIRPAPDTGFAAQVREAQIPRLFFTLLGAHACEYGLWILSWWLLGWMT